MKRMDKRTFADSRRKTRPRDRHTTRTPALLFDLTPLSLSHHNSSPLHALATTFTHDLTPHTNATPKTVTEPATLGNIEKKQEKKKPIPAYQTGAKHWELYLRFRRQHWEEQGQRDPEAF